MMLSNGFAAPLRLDFRPSRQCLLLISLITGFALLAVVQIDLPWLFRFGLLVLILLWFVRSLRLMGWRGQSAASRRVEWRDEQWHVSYEGKMAFAQLLGFSLIGQSMIILRFSILDAQGRTKKRYWFSCQDGLQADAFRHLRVFLRHAPMGNKDEAEN